MKPSTFGNVSILRIHNGELGGAQEASKKIEENKEIEPTIIPSNVDEYKIRLNKVWVGKPTITEADGSDYESFFKKALNKFGVSSPGDFDSEEKKKEFFNYVDKNFTGKNETD